MLSDIIKPKICELGKIKIGRLGAERTSAKGNKYRQPEKLDHFIVTTMNRDKEGNLTEDKDLMDDLRKNGYADADQAIRRLPIRVLSDDLEDIMQASYCCYIRKRCAIRSDGRETTWFAKDGKWLETPVVEPWDPTLLDRKGSDGKPLLKMNVVFNCVIASNETRFGGVHRLRTTSTISAAQLYGSLSHLLGLTGGVLVGMPLQLAIRPMQVSPAELDGKSTTVYVLHVEMVGKDVKALQQDALDQMRFRLQYQKEIGRSMIEYRKLLTAPGLETDPREAADVQEEFYPETSHERVEPKSETDPLLTDNGQASEMPPSGQPIESRQAEESPPVDPLFSADPAQDMDSRAPVEEIEDMRETIRQLELSEPEVRKILKQFGIKSMSSMTRIQANALGQKLGQIEAQAQGA